MNVVSVQLFIEVPGPVRSVPAVIVNASEGSTAKTVLDMAGKQNPSYVATYKQEDLGDFITSIDGVYNDQEKRYSWFIYINDKEADVGVDDLKPKDQDFLSFKYRKYTPSWGKWNLRQSDFQATCTFSRTIFTRTTINVGRNCYCIYRIKSKIYTYSDWSLLNSNKLRQSHSIHSRQLLFSNFHYCHTHPFSALPPPPPIKA